MPVFEPDDFSISWKEREYGYHVNHFEVSEQNREENLGSAILETMKRIAYYEGADRLTISMGGGEAAEEFLKANDFEIVRRRDYGEEEALEGNFGVDAQFRFN